MDIEVPDVVNRRIADLAADRIVMVSCTLFMNPSRIRKVAAALKPATLLGFHRALKERKYRRLFSPQRRGKPGPKGPSKELIQVIVEMKRRNPRYGCPRIAQQLSKAFGIEIDKDVVRRVLAKYYWPRPGGRGPSWLTFIGHAKDSLWSVDLFRCESITLKMHWVLVVMDQSTRRIIGFAAHSDAKRPLIPIQNGHSDWANDRRRWVIPWLRGLVVYVL